MYRQKVAEVDEVPEQFIEKLHNLPVVSSAVGRLGALYTGTKEHNRLFRFTLQTAESGLGLVISTAKPVIAKFEKPIGQLNDIACVQLNKLEHDYPIITKPTEEVLKATSETCCSAVKPITDRVESAKGYGIGKVSDVKNYTYGKIDSVKGGVKDKIDGVKGYTCDKVGGVKDKIDGVKGYTYGKVGGVKDKIDGVKVYAYDKVGGAKDYTFGKIHGVKTYSAEKLMDIKNYSADRFKSAREYSTDKLTSAREYSTDKFKSAREYSAERVSKAQQLGAQRMNEMMEHSTRSMLSTRLRSAFDVANNYVDFYLPEEADSTQREPLSDMTDEERKIQQERTLFVRSLELAEKLRRRMYARLRKQLQVIREKGESLKSGDQVITAPSKLIPADVRAYVWSSYDAVRSRVVFVWTEINKEEEEEEKEIEGRSVTPSTQPDFNNRTMERRLIATGRHVNHRVRQGLSTIHDNYMPAFILQFVHHAQTLTHAFLYKTAKSQLETKAADETELSENKLSKEDEDNSSASSEYRVNEDHQHQSSVGYDESVNSTQDYSSNEELHDSMH